MFAKTEVYLKRYAPGPPTIIPPPQDATASSLAPTQFTELFGEGSEEMLQDVLDGEEWSPAQRALATHILGGEKSIKELTGEDRAVLDDIAHQLVAPRPVAPPPPTPTRPSWVATQGEMESFPNEYQPHPSQRDWPMSPDHPEGEQ